MAFLLASFSEDDIFLTNQAAAGRSRPWSSMLLQNLLLSLLHHRQNWATLRQRFSVHLRRIEKEFLIFPSPNFLTWLALYQRRSELCSALRRKRATESLEG